MDEFLARIYGTGGAEDIEKTAQQQMLAKLAAEENIDLSGMSDEDLQALSDSVLGPEGGGEGDELEAEAQQQLIQKEAEAKAEEADFLGRVMAHSYTQELEKIAAAKTASPIRRFRTKTASAFDKLAEARAGEMLEAVGAEPGGAGGADPGQDAGQQPQIPAQAISQEIQRRQQARAQQGQPGQQQPGRGGPPGMGMQQPQQGQQPGQQFRMQQQPQQQQPGQMMGGQQPGQGQQPGTSDQFEGALNQRAFEMLAQQGYDPEAIYAALMGGQQPQQPQQPQQQMGKLR